MDITTIVTAIITLLGAVLTAFVVPLLKNKLSADKLAALSNTITTLVQAAEQLYGTGTGQQKLDYVVSMLAAKGIAVDMDNVADSTRAMIEAAVLQLK